VFGRGAQKLSGASLLVYANKQDIKGALSHDDIAQVLGLHNINQR
jgi:ADP-ribosylation factor-like protein 2